MVINLNESRVVDQITNIDNVSYDIYKLCEIILEISHLHSQFSTENINAQDINLKSKQVRHVVRKYGDDDAYIIDSLYLKRVRKYLSNLDFLTVETDLDYIYKEFDFRLRVKQPESIIYKLGYYFIGKEEKGQISINKCLNDLLGFRISLPYFDHECSDFKKMCEIIKKFYRIKYINSSKGEYRATHIYFLGNNNKYYPWELQVWLPEHFEQNHKSHEKHKQGYINSASIHKSAFDALREV